MAKNIYVGNISYDTNEDAIRDMFSEFGLVESVKVIIDRDTGRSKGFGFVEMESEEDAQVAISALNEKLVDGRNLKVNEARERKSFNRDRRF